MVHETPILYHFITVLFISSDVRNLRGTGRKQRDGTIKIERNSPMCSSCGQVLTRHTLVRGLVTLPSIPLSTEL